jgi:sensor histidine kinase YesM
LSYIGNTPADKYQTLEKQSFTTSATTGYTLSYSVSSPQDIALFINNVRQNPNSSYTVSGTTLTLSSATTGTDVMYAVFLGKSVGTIAPALNSVTTSMMASGVLPTNTPSFLVQKNTDQSISSGTWTKLTWETEVYDTNNAFASDKFVAPIAGKYFISASTYIDEIDAGEEASLRFALNGTQTNMARVNGQSGGADLNVFINTHYIFSLSVNDYVEVYAQHNEGGARSAYSSSSFFSGFKLIGV